MQEYKSVTTYRVDQQSEKSLDKLRISFIIMIVLFVVIILLLAVKIRIFVKSIGESKKEIVESRN